MKVKVISYGHKKKHGDTAEVVIIQEGYSMTRHCVRSGLTWKDKDGNHWEETKAA